MTPQSKPRPALHTPDAAALRCARVALAGMRRGWWWLCEGRAANDGGEARR